MSKPIALAAVLALTAAGVAAADRVVADVGTRQITAAEFAQVLRSLRTEGGTSAALRTLTPTGRQQILTAYIDRALYAAGARDEGLDKRADVQLQVEAAVEAVLANAYVRQQQAAFPASDGDLKRFYEAHRDDFRTPSRVRARHIQVKTRAEAEAALARIKAGESFAKVASEISVDQTTRAKGGELGWVSPGVMVKPFDQALFSLKKGQISGIVHTSFGFHIIQVEDVQETSLPPFEAVKAEVRKKLMAFDLAQLKQQLETRHPVHVHTDVFETVK